MLRVRPRALHAALRPPGAKEADGAAPVSSSCPWGLQMGRIFQLQRNLTRPAGGLPVLRHTAYTLAAWPSPIHAL